MYLVTGATGDLGRRVIRILREQDLPVRAFVRLSSKYSELENRGAELFIGDLLEKRDIDKACQGIQHIISVHGSNTSGDGDAQALDYRANIDLIDAAKEIGVQHFVFVSVLGVDRGYDDAPVFKAKRAVEKYLRKSGLNYTILRPSGFASNLLPLAERVQQTGIYMMVGDPKIRTSVVSTDDLARITVASCEVEGAKNQILSVGGPQILERGDIPTILGRVFNRDPLVIPVPLPVVDGIRTAIGLFDADTQKSLGTFRTLISNEFFCTLDEIAKLENMFDLKLETLEHFVRRYKSA